MARTITATLETAQEGTAKIPYTRVVINSVDYSDRVLSIEHFEEPYREQANIFLRNDDLHFNGVDLTGKQFKIGYGLTTGVTESTWAASTGYSKDDVVIPSTPNDLRYRCSVAGTSNSFEPTWPTTPGATVQDNTVTWEMHGDSGDECSETADLWIKRQRMYSREGVLVCELLCEGQWTFLREQRIVAMAVISAGSFVVGDMYKITFVGTTDFTAIGASANEVGIVFTATGAGSGTGTALPFDNPYYIVQYDGSTDTIYGIIRDAIEVAMSWTLDAAPSPDDGILTTFKPVFDINQQPYENIATLMYRLIYLTKCSIRSKADQIFEIIYPQAGDGVDITYYSDSAPYFYEYMEEFNLVIPNRIAVYANQDAASWDNIVVGEDTESGSISAYTTVLQPYIMPDVTTEANADKMADAILSKIKSEEVIGRALIPHDARVEVDDKLSFVDNRGATRETYPTDGLTRVGSLVHRYDRLKGIYHLEIVLGGVSAAFGFPGRITGVRTAFAPHREEPSIKPPLDYPGEVPPGPPLDYPGEVPPKPSPSRRRLPPYPIGPPSRPPPYPIGPRRPSGEPGKRRYWWEIWNW